ncbi:MAG: LLM class flavin-dependent oxidoreductase [Pseudorhodoplanes sp.]
MTVAKRQLHLGLFLFGTGAFLAGWRIPGATDNNEDIASLQRIAAQAERAKFDLVFLADNLACLLDYHPSEMAKLEPMVELSALGVLTSHIGLGGTVSTSFSEPYNVARMVSSLDHVSRGRAAWNVVNASIPESAENFGRPKPIHDEFSHDERYEIAGEFIQVVKALWDSWSDDAFVRDRGSGMFVDPSKVRPINHQGKYFSVKGPLNSSRPPQGHPVIIMAGSSPAGQRCAARHAEMVFTNQQTVPEAKIFYDGIKQQAAAAGRKPDHCNIMPGLFPIVAPTREEARAKLEKMATYIDDRLALGTLAVRFGHDMSQFPLDGPMPVLPKQTSYSRLQFARAERENLTWRQLYNILAISRGYCVACGSPTDVADLMEEWLTERACDGFMITASHFPDGFRDFTDLVVPELQRRGIFRKEYRGSTLRDHLGLPRPENRSSV